MGRAKSGEMRWEKAARRRLSKEQGTIFKDWGGRIPIALIYPNTYYVGMSNLGFQTIYGLLNSYDNIVCERVFWERGGGSVESGRPLDDFAVLAFSISYELDYFNVVEML
ncbi:MAG: radical SAM protein, partial [Dehalococcoidia bacterium]|nr:radical SAM protein [Dehalococcoidia bacterium]